MNQNEWVAQFEATYHRKPTAQEFQAAKTSGQFVTQEIPKATTMLQAKNKRRNLIVGISIAVTVLGILVFVLFGMGPKISDLDGVWINPADSISFVYELNDKKKLFNGKKDIEKLAEGDKAKADFEKFIKAENNPKIKTLADFDKHFKLNTKAIFSAYIDENKIYHLLQNDGSMIIYDSRSGINSSNDSQYIKRLRFYKVQYPKAFVGEWKIRYKNSENSKNVSISDVGIVNIESDRDEEYNSSDSSRLGLYPFVEYTKLISDNPEEKLSEKEVGEKIAMIKESVSEEGYQVQSNKDIYIDINSNNYFVVVQNGKKILILDTGGTIRASLER
ncbi:MULTISPECIES: hypothetical protein [Streptococcus]|jgi:hypothetical protein|uniref:Uncharacterized protein n=1 Tax=Streptococcus sanguinis TaxID=1305 RepID=A0A2X3Y5A3_STRSA|nr:MULTISPECIES: hypothetical protein [Streptococcus]MBF1698176.1 hypothetical protein [Streptococcus cristatus]RSI06929.1 hypothetical protein D8888_10670 [Streptococcus sanguinis]WNU95130.1 hypothetical protein RSK81_01680 [Streptococcus sp. DTU_2020_1000888_1_SI_GRL_NUU_041A]SQF70498.1 Uncharacterised protein [Streptococcus sanguinis]